ncbi:AzlC family ABC transporter permease [Gulosibacter bifidus]|uniref:AzlC family ABC transporter permease n=1 Tax=Gulosibacter bifidus TaxID=272239 RepID=A0ABW5RJ57_9MICO|nr:AzlC family ABC transporter permease [Gulosibacter bifidus]
MPHSDTAQPADLAQVHREEIKAGLKDGLTIAWAYLPFGMSYGMYAHSQGLPWWLAAITALLIFAGSVEFLVAGMLAAAAPIATIATTTFLVNSRHLVYGLSVPIERIKNPWLRAYGIHCLTDEMYAVCTSLPRSVLTPRRMLAIGASGHFYWVSGTTIGSIIALFLPFDLSFMSFAVVALFVVLALEAARVSGEWWMLAAGLAIATAAALVVPQLTMLVGLVGYCTLATVVIARRRFRNVTGGGA